MRKPNLRHAAVALSLANLCFAKWWAHLLMLTVGPEPVNRDDYVWAVIGVVVVGLLFWGGASLIRRVAGPLAPGATALAASGVLLAALYANHHAIWPSRPIFGSLGVLSPSAVCAVSALVLAAGLIITFRRPHHVARALGMTALIFLPFVGLTFGQSVWGFATYRSPERYHAPARPAQPTGHPQVVVLLFDEFDAGLAFGNRPESVAMPEFDRLRRESVDATHAFPPGGCTIHSIPAYLTGQWIAGAEPDHSRDLLYTVVGETVRRRLSQSATFLSTLKAAGVSCAVLTGVLPYRQMIPGQADYISERLNWRHPPHPVPALMRQWRSLALSLPFAGRLRLTERLSMEADRQDYIDGHRILMDEAVRVLTKGDFRMVWAHLCPPHEPFVYDRHRDDYTTARGSSYLDNLELADRMLGEIRRPLEESGRWHSTALVVISDHWWRERHVHFPGKPDHRVPFLVKLPGATQGVRYETPFNTLLLHDLLPDLVAGSIKRPSDLIRWLDEHRECGESPATVALP